MKKRKKGPQKELFSHLFFQIGDEPIDELRVSVGGHVMAGFHKRVNDVQVGFHQLLRAAPAAGFAVEITTIAAQVT